MASICFVTTCMGRLAHLRESLGRVVGQRDCSCVVVDYSCPDRCGDWVEATHPRVRVVRIEGKTTFNRCIASNAGARAADAPWICFFDADICFEPNFAEAVLPLLQPGQYYRPQPLNDCAMADTFLCRRDDFERVGGYDEVYEGWGEFDLDAYAALEFIGVMRQGFPSSLLRHIPHDDQMRARFHVVKDLEASVTANHVYRGMKFDAMRLTRAFLPRAVREDLYRGSANIARAARQDGPSMDVHFTIPGTVYRGGRLDRILTFRYRKENADAAEPKEVSGGPAAAAAPSPVRPAETSMQALYESLTPQQRVEVCFDWNHRCPRRGLLRAFVANHWQITRPCIRSDFFTAKQQQLIHDIFKSVVSPEWYPRFLKQLHDDTKGHPWGANQSIGLFGTPGGGPFQLIFTGRHLTLRADGNKEGRAAFGGPILYGHAASGYHEKPHHSGNVFWSQALQASQVYHMLDGKQRRLAVTPRMPAEEAIAFRGPAGPFPGVPVSELAADQKAELGRTLGVLLEPFRAEDRDRVLDCLREQGGLERCGLAFYQEGQMSGDCWDNWRLEGPAFVWYFCGSPHVHVWVNVASDPTLPVHARIGRYLFPNHDPLT